jgi:DNA-binding transcriptional LysR family regulator
VQQQHPGIVVELVTSTRPLSLRGSGHDIAVTIGSASSSRLPSEVLAPYSLRLYASPDYLASHPAIESVADLENHNLVFYVDALLTVHELDLAPVLNGMRVGFGSTNVFAQLEATRRGAGVGLLHAFMGEPDPGLVPVLAREVDFRLQFALSVRRDSIAVDAVAVVRDAIREEVRARATELSP